jgi:hypothetical protein
MDIPSSRSSALGFPLPALARCLPWPWVHERRLPPAREAVAIQMRKTACAAFGSNGRGNWEVYIAPLSPLRGTGPPRCTKQDSIITLQLTATACNHA